MLQNSSLEIKVVQPKILIVDDNAANVLLLERMLRISGYTDIVTTTDSREALRLYHTIHPDLLLLDLQMPYYSGFDILEQLNNYKEGDYLPVIVITAQNDKENKIKALELGAKDFIGKPFDHTEILMRIRNMLEMRMLHMEVRGQNQKLEEKVKERTKELQDLQLELILRLLKAAEFRDDDTGSHIKRIERYAYSLAKAFGLSEKDCTLIGHASMMHDIGKIGIPDEVLLKKGKLDPVEWDIMMTHAVKGGQILAGSNYELIKVAEQIALTHHERWDGSGYPNGLKGEEIPLAGRITAICDVFDALLSKRPYKPAWKLSEVTEEISKGRGTHFDPMLVECFLANLQSFIDIREQFK